MIHIKALIVKTKTYTDTQLYMVSRVKQNTKIITKDVHHYTFIVHIGNHPSSEQCS